MRSRSLIALLPALAMAQACSGSSSNPETGTQGGNSSMGGSGAPPLQTGGSPSIGGAAIQSGGGPTNGGTSTQIGGSASGGATSSGSSTGTTGGQAGGGNATGGVIAYGGATTTGGKASGGGLSNGGAAATGGKAANGGTNTGGTNIGGAMPSGGTAASGGKAMGGTNTGGKAMGGTNTGGKATGGAATTGGSGIGAGATGCAYPAPTGSPVAMHGQLKVVGSKLQNQSGAQVQLKGISSYWLNWENTKYAESKPALQYMRDNWKLMALRASMGTDASGGYLTSAANQMAMQARMDEIVLSALSLGVYVLLDWHTERAVDQQAQSVAFFTSMAQKYGACPNVIYEDYNEPTSVTWAQIKPYHQVVVSAIRAVDPDNLIVLGTPNWSQDVDIAAQDPVPGTNLLYTLHWYSCSHKAGLRTKGTTAMSRGIALFVTEFGVTPANGGVAPTNTVCEEEGTLWFNWMQQNGVSGMAWKLASGTDSSNIFMSGNKPPVDGPFPDSFLSQTNGASPGHGQFIVNWLRQ